MESYKETLRFLLPRRRTAACSVNITLVGAGQDFHARSAGETPVAASAGCGGRPGRPEQTPPRPRAAAATPRGCGSPRQRGGEFGIPRRRILRSPVRCRWRAGSVRQAEGELKSAGVRVASGEASPRGRKGFAYQRWREDGERGVRGHRRRLGHRRPHPPGSGRRLAHGSVCGAERYWAPGFGRRVRQRGCIRGTACFCRATNGVAGHGTFPASERIRRVWVTGDFSVGGQAGAGERGAQGRRRRECGPRARIQFEVE